MAQEAQQYDPAGALPPVADRRAPERRTYQRPGGERVLVARTAGAAAVAFCGGLVLVFIFFWAFGAVDVTDAVAATIAGQLTGAAVIDQFGLLGLSKTPLSATRVVGIALLAVGVFLVVRK